MKKENRETLPKRSSRQALEGTPRKSSRNLYSSSQHFVSHRDALGEIKDETEDKFDVDTWFSADEKRNKMTKESIVKLLEEFPLPPPFFARVPALQEPANYGTDLETSVYEGHIIRSGYRVPMHPFAVAFFNHYKMAPGQLVPNGWRKLVGLIYLVQTSGYPVTIHDFMRLYLEVCFIKNVANSVGWYYIHNRVRVIKGVLNPTKVGTPDTSSFSGQAKNGSSQESGTKWLAKEKCKRSLFRTAEKGFQGKKEGGCKGRFFPYGKKAQRANSSSASARG
ncbi:hypothetical protein RJ639_017383 [Escallonia herrerae]|uniref:Transposase (putative) gypsy type domain-containing protein n=1 Tax=Escallonia herrerae TaxID=1293975 RepID=A0AA88VC29_9ASTE|nr:hypothetical protein RJ639_017383 [Escallonia herrerae]